jgi:hypothetical protein
MKQDLLVGHSLLLRDLKSLQWFVQDAYGAASPIKVVMRRGRYLAYLAYFSLTGIVFSFFCASGDFGIVTVRTPLL